VLDTWRNFHFLAGGLFYLHALELFEHRQVYEFAAAWVVRLWTDVRLKHGIFFVFVRGGVVRILGAVVDGILLVTRWIRMALE